MGLLTAVLSGFGVMTVLNLVSTHGGLAVMAVSLLLFCGVFLIQVLHSAQRTRAFRDRYGRLTLGLQALLTFTPMCLLGMLWGGMAGFLAGSVLLVVRGRLSGVLFLLVVAANGASAALSGLGAVDIAYVVLSTALTGLVVFATTRLVDLITELERRRAESAWVAVTEERLRIARDLHDLLGYSLSAITLKSELVHRLIGLHDDRARTELGEVLEISREALADVRAVARGYREVLFADELVSVRKVLAAADVECVVEDVAVGTLGRQINTVLATVLREAVTNLLRHTSAKRCTIRLRRYGATVQLAVDNDGVRPEKAGARRHGSGLDNLSERVSRAGGTLTTLFDSDGWFRLMVECPTADPDSTRDVPHPVPEHSPSIVRCGS
ncbi:two-component sensor histidine kinase [Streptomyces sp. SID8376]|nr:two-component sensor histidine kinase [Streptomyces sp. SID8376]